MTDDVDPGAVHIVETVPDADAAGDVIHGRGPRPRRQWAMRPSWLAGLLAAALLAGIGIGFLIGRHSGPDRPDAAPPATGPSTVAHLPQLRTGQNCFTLSAKTGDALTVGVELVNNGSRPAVLSAAKGLFPMGGMEQAGSVQVGKCGATTQAVYAYPIQPGRRAWLLLNLDVQVRCPAPLPVQIQVDYTVDGAPVTQTLRPFPDLGKVSYPGCPTR